MANTQDQASLNDHNYSMDGIREACFDELIEEEMQMAKPLSDHNPFQSPNPKKMKRRDESKKVNMESIYDAIHALSQRFEERLDAFERKFDNFDQRIQNNEKEVTENKNEIIQLKAHVDRLTKENKELKERCREIERYGRRWNLKLIGLPEKENEDTREMVIGILTRVIPISVEQLRDKVDTVHRLGKKDDPAFNMRPRPIIVQFGMRTTRDEIWRRSREARVCKELHVQFRQDWSKEDREARAKLYPTVQEARRNGKKAYLKEG
ncbi:hypothetical protein M9458_051369, partial [Cirrhinus mrigala]